MCLQFIHFKIRISKSKYPISSVNLFHLCNQFCQPVPSFVFSILDSDNSIILVVINHLKLPIVISFGHIITNVSKYLFFSFFRIQQDKSTSHFLHWFHSGKALLIFHCIVVITYFGLPAETLLCLQSILWTVPRFFLWKYISVCHSLMAFHFT